MKLLVIATTWPSKEHPYLVYLFARLKERYPDFQFFLFREERDTRAASELVGEAAVAEVRKNALYRFAIRGNPFSYFRAFFRIIGYLPEAVRIFNRCRKDGYRTHQAIGQLLYNYQLIGRRYDLVYVNALQTAKHFSLRSFFSNCEIIASSRGQDFDWHPSGYDKVLRDIDHLHVLGNYLQLKAIERGLPSCKITIIPPAILPRSGRELKALEDDTLYIVSSSRLVWTKGYVYCLRAFSLLLRMLPEGQKCQYVVLGDGPDWDLIKVEVSRLKLDQHVLLEGWVDQTTVNEWLSRSHIYMLLSIEEGFNNSVMQAQSFGLPCIVSDAGGLPDNVIDGETGFVVPRYDCEVAAKRLYQLAVDESLRGRMGQRASERMEAEFSLTTQVSKYAEMFDRMVEETV